tara:strand:- start:2494 stop:3237 length:744 start_codon:yes stop_codon:yes gene_type:complete
MEVDDTETECMEVDGAEPKWDGLQLQDELQKNCSWLSSDQVKLAVGHVTAHTNAATAGRILQLVIQCSVPDLSLLASRTEEILCTEAEGVSKQEAQQALAAANVADDVIQLTSDIIRNTRKYRILGLRLANTWHDLKHCNAKKSLAKKRQNQKSSVKAQSEQRKHAASLATQALCAEVICQELPDSERLQMSRLFESYLDVGRNVRFLCEQLGYWILAALPGITTKPRFVPSAISFPRMKRAITPDE